MCAAYVIVIPFPQSRPSHPVFHIVVNSTTVYQLPLLATEKILCSSLFYMLHPIRHEILCIVLKYLFEPIFRINLSRLVL